MVANDPYPSSTGKVFAQSFNLRRNSYDDGH